MTRTAQFREIYQGVLTANPPRYTWDMMGSRIAWETAIKEVPVTEAGSLTRAGDVVRMVDGTVGAVIMIANVSNREPTHVFLDIRGADYTLLDVAEIVDTSNRVRPATCGWW